MDELRNLLQESLNGSLYQIMISGARGNGTGAARKKVRPVMMKGALFF